MTKKRVEVQYLTNTRPQNKGTNQKFCFFLEMLSLIFCILFQNSAANLNLHSGISGCPVF